MTICRKGSNSIYWTQKLHIDESAIKNINDYIAREVGTGNFPFPITEDMIAEAFNAIDNNADILGVFHIIDDKGYVQEMKVACYIVNLIEEYMFDNCNREIFYTDNFNCGLPFLVKEN